MIKKLQISDDLVLPLDFITHRSSVYGDSGAGKTTLGRLLAEKIHEAGQRFGIIDLKNDWFGLKSSADGKREGLPVVIFGGPRAEVKLFDDANAAATLAQTVASIDQSFIIDLDALSRAKQERFLASFLNSFYESNRRPLLMFMDEADRYAPQKPMTQDGIMSLSSSEDIARRGRKRGIGSFWITQRTAVLNKNVSELANNLVIIFRTPGSRDLSELEERVGRICPKDIVKQVLSAAPGLADGEAFFLSSHPNLRKCLPDPVRPLQMPMPWTFDSSATPGVGQRRREPKVLAQSDLAAIEEKMAAQVERAKAEDPRELRKRVQELERELKEKPAATVESKPPKIIEKPVMKDRDLKRIEGAAMKIREAMDGIRSIFEGSKVTVAAAAIDDVHKRVREAVNWSPIETPWVKPIALRPRMTKAPATISNRLSPRPGPPMAEAVADAGSLGKGETKVLTALIQFPDGLRREQLTTLTGYKRSTRNTYLQRLGAAGLVSGDEHVVATDAGRAALPNAEPLPTGSALRELWLQRLPSGEAQILRLLIEAYPVPVEREALTEMTGFKRSTRNTYLQRMSAKQVVVDAGGTTVKASDNLFAD